MAEEKSGKPSRGGLSQVKSDPRDNYPFGLLARPRAQLTRLHASSGATGKPTVVG